LSGYRLEHGKAGEAICSIWLQVEALASSIGKVPTTQLAFEYLSPLAWASIGSIAEKLDYLGKHIDLHNSRLDSHKADINLSVENHVKLSRDNFYHCLDAFKTAFISTSRGLGGRLDNVKFKLIGVIENTNHRAQQLTSQHAPKSNSGFNLERTTGTRNESTTDQGQDAANQKDKVASDELVRVETRVDNTEKSSLA
jgi:hypothetical protein